MKKILIITTHVDIEERLKGMLESNILPEAEYSVVVEFYEAVPKKPDIFKNYFPISDLRERDEINAAIEACKTWGDFDYILQTDEYAVYLAAEIRERLNFPGLHTKDVVKFRDKVMMKNALNGRVRAPYIYELEEVINKDIFPVVVKPRSYAGSKGISIIKSVDELNLYFKENNINEVEKDRGFKEFALDEVELEEYIEGEIFHIDGFVFEQKVTLCLASKYLGTCLEYINGKPLGSISVGDVNEQEKWRIFTEEVNRVMNLPDGAYHLEAFLTNKGERVFLEIGVRPGGALVVPAVEEATGINLDNVHLQCQLGIEPKIDWQKHKNYGWLIFPKDFNAVDDRTVKKVEIPKANLHSVIISTLPEVGDSFASYFSYMNNLGSFIFSSEDNSKIYEDMQLLLDEYSVT